MTPGSQLELPDDGAATGKSRKTDHTTTTKSSHKRKHKHRKISLKRQTTMFPTDRNQLHVSDTDNNDDLLEDDEDLNLKRKDSVETPAEPMTPLTAGLGSNTGSSRQSRLSIKRRPTL